MDLHKTQEE